MFFASAIKRKFTKQSPRAGFVSVDYPLCPIIIVNIARTKRLSSHLFVVPYSGNLS